MIRICNPCLSHIPISWLWESTRCFRSERAPSSLGIRPAKSTGEKERRTDVVTLEQQSCLRKTLVLENNLSDRQQPRSYRLGDCGTDQDCATCSELVAPSGYGLQEHGRESMTRERDSFFMCFSKMCPAHAVGAPQGFGRDMF